MAKFKVGDRVRVEAMDYRVDSSKMIWGPPRPNGPDGTIRFPAQCTARCPIPRPKDSLWTRFLCFIFWSHTDRRDAEREDWAGQQCQDYIGHWEYPERRQHRTAWGYEWDVSPSMIKAFNPDNPP